jgi:hypothetical protein
MLRFLWFFAGIGVVFGGIIVVGTLMTATGAPQEAAGAAIRVACGVLPYCFARAAQELSGKK